MYIAPPTKHCASWRLFLRPALSQSLAEPSGSPTFCFVRDTKLSRQSGATFSRRSNSIGGNNCRLSVLPPIGNKELCGNKGYCRTATRPWRCNRVPEYLISLSWDSEASVWIATSEDIPGLVLESGSLDALIERVRFAAPELLSLNKKPEQQTLSMCFRSERRELIRV
ncbi:MAG: DUF1902 domain-containing protein [Clostridiales Family XIII bacterium]|nr:DUF1902 domain-containing protein [Clostridiales Family XIII bacterium]